MKNENYNVMVTSLGENLLVTYIETMHQYIVNQDGSIRELTQEEKNNIIDVVVKGYVLTAGGKVRKVNLVEGDVYYTAQLTDEVITSKGIKKKGDFWFLDGDGKIYMFEKESNEAYITPICMNNSNEFRGVTIEDVYEIENYYLLAKDTQGKLYCFYYDEENFVGECLSNSGALEGVIITDIYDCGLVKDNTGKLYDSYTNECLNNRGDLGNAVVDGAYYVGGTYILKDTDGKIYTLGGNIARTIRKWN